MAEGYYVDKLAAERLRRCYEVAPPRVCQYLEAEAVYACERTAGLDPVLELGCGYGRILPHLASGGRTVVGIDTSVASLRLAVQMRSAAGEVLPAAERVLLAAMDAARLGFLAETFGAVVCIQNGLSAFKVDPRGLVEEALRVTRPGGRAIFSSYADCFWSDRLEWFRRQAAAGLLGEIDDEQTRDGVIVCKDGFRATTIRHDDFAALAAGLPARAEIVEIDGSSLFCVLTK